MCLEEKHSLMGWLSFVTQMAEQMRCGNSKLVYRFKMHKPGSSGRGGWGRSKRRAEAGWRLSSPARHGFVWPGLSVVPEGTRTSSRSSALPCLQACCPEPLESARPECGWKSHPQSCCVHMVSSLWKLLTGGMLELSLFVPQTAHFYWFFSP